MEKKELILNNSDIPEELHNAREVLFKNNFDDFHRLGVYLRQKYPDDFWDYRMYHFFTHSTVGKNDCGKHDFPGEDSIEKILKEGRFPEFKVDKNKIIS